MAQDADLTYDAYLLVATFWALWLLEFPLRWSGFATKRDNLMYFSLHIVINFAVVVLHFPDVIHTYMDPANAARGPTHTAGIVMVTGLHLYHIAFYRPLPLVDWVHHILMVLFCVPTAYVQFPGYLLAHGSFYASGLPGGIDYVMLVCVKKGWMTSLQEKHYNAIIQQWIRLPGCLIHSVLAWVCLIESYKLREQGIPREAPGNMPSLVNWETAVAFTMITVVMFYWNGIFFAGRVVRSHERHLVMQQYNIRMKEVKED